MNTWIVPQNKNGVRLDHFLRECLPDISRSALQKQIVTGAFLVNDLAVSSHHFLKGGDTISRHQVKKGAVNKEKMTLPALTVVGEESTFLVVEKPEGYAVHPGAGVRGPTISEMVCAQYPEVNNVGDASRPGIVHRLDKDVSGLLLVARTPESLAYFQNAFRERRMEKIYIALVMGVVPGEFGTIDRPIARSARRDRMAARAPGQEGKDAVTHWEVLTRYVNATLLRVRIETGRTHQIRAHLLSIGHPVVGDPLYKMKAQKIRPTPPRLMLHAHSLSFVDDSGVARSYTSHLPALMNDYLLALSAV